VVQLFYLSNGKGKENGSPEMKSVKAGITNCLPDGESADKALERQTAASNSSEQKVKEKKR